MYDSLQQQVLFDAGALPALHYILKRNADIQNPEIMSLGCEVISNLLNAPDGDSKRNEVDRADMVDALVGLIEYVTIHT